MQILPLRNLLVVASALLACGGPAPGAEDGGLPKLPQVPPGPGATSQCLPRCTAKARACGAPAAAAESRCAALCSGAPTDAQLSCLDTQPCSELSGSSTPCGLGSAPDAGPPPGPTSCPFACPGLPLSMESYSGKTKVYVSMGAKCDGPSSGGGLTSAGAACKLATDCIFFRCPACYCGKRIYSASACIDGVCAGKTEACAAAQPLEAGSPMCDP